MMTCRILQSGRRAFIVVALIAGMSGSVHAQLVAGAEGIVVKGGTVFSVDELWLTPDFDFELSNTSLIRQPVGISWPKLNGIRRTYEFGAPVRFAGAFGFRYYDSELLGNNPATLSFAVSALRSTRGEDFKLLSGGIVDIQSRMISAPKAELSDLTTLTAVTPLSVEGMYEILLPNNILSPDGDGVNDVWLVKYIEDFPNNELTVFDRTGRVVYQKNGYDNTWDGSVNGRPLSEDTYYYVLTVDSGKKQITGYISVVRSE